MPDKKWVKWGWMIAGIVPFFLAGLVILVAPSLLEESLLEARRHPSWQRCVFNMRQIDGALQQLLIEEETNAILIARFRGTATSDDIPDSYLKNPENVRCPLARAVPYIITNFCVMCPGHMMNLKEYKRHTLEQPSN